MFEYFDSLCVVYFRAYGTNGQEELNTFPNFTQGESGNG